MNILLGNLKFTDIGDKDKMIELEERLSKLGYSREENCEKNTNTERLTYHIYDIPKQINFSVLSDEVVAILKQYDGDFNTRVAVSADKKV